MPSRCSRPTCSRGRVGLGALFAPVPDRRRRRGAARPAPPGLGRLFTRGELVERAARRSPRRWLAAGVPTGTRLRGREEPLAPARAGADRRGPAGGPVRQRRCATAATSPSRWSRPAGRGRGSASSEPGGGRRRGGALVVDRAARWPPRRAPALGERMLELRYERLRAEPRDRLPDAVRALRDPGDVRRRSTTPLDRDGHRARRAAERRGPPIRAGRVGEWRGAVRDPRRAPVRADRRRRRSSRPATSSIRRWWLRQPLRSRL